MNTTMRIVRSALLVLGVAAAVLGGSAVAQAASPAPAGAPASAVTNPVEDHLKIKRSD